MASDYAAQIGDHETQLLLLNSANERLASASDEWVECFDEESGYPFWLNANTGETEVGWWCLLICGSNAWRGFVVACTTPGLLTLLCISRSYFVNDVSSSGATNRPGQTMKPKCRKQWK